MGGFGNNRGYNFETAYCSKLQVSPLRAWDRLYLWARSEKRGRSTLSLSSKFIGLKMKREIFWQIFIDQEISNGLLYIRHLWGTNISVLKLYFSEVHA